MFLSYAKSFPSVLILGDTPPSLSNLLQISKSPTGIGLNDLVFEIFLLKESIFP